MDFKIKNVNPIITYSVTAIIAVAAYFFFLNLGNIFNSISWIISIIKPFLFGFILAYLLNVPMSFLEENLFERFLKKDKFARLRRILATLLTIILAIAFLTLLMVILIPQLMDNIETLSKTLPNQIYGVKGFLDGLLTRYNISTEQINKIMPSVDQVAQTISTSSSWLFNLSSQIISGLATALISLVLSIYFLIDKESFIAQTKKLLYVVFSKEKTVKIIEITRLTHSTFIKYISGIFLDALTISFLCFLGMLVIYRPYALLFAVIIGLTNMVPFFGPVIGAIPTSLLLLITAPDKVIWFLLFILVLQQTDANVIGPRIVGNSIGLPAHWVIFAILVGGGLFGFIGMLIGIPVFAVIYLLLTTFVNEKYNEKLKEDKKNNGEHK